MLKLKTTYDKINFHKQLNKVTEDYFDTLLFATRNELTEWEKTLQDALSDYLPYNKHHKLRQPRNRDFPYLNSGKLKRSVFIFTDVRKTAKTLRLDAKAGIFSDHAIFTNLGLKHPKIAQEGSWKGWMDDVLFGSGRRNVKSLRSIFDNLRELRRQL